MNCPDQEVIEYYIAGQLKAKDLTEFEKHLQACPACKAKVAEARLKRADDGYARRDILDDLRH